MRRLHEVRFLLGLAGWIIGAPGAAVGQDGGMPHANVAARSPLFLALESAGDAPKGNRWVDVSNAAVFRRRIKLELRGVSRERALAEIARQAGLQLTYSAAVVSLNTPVTLIAKDLTVGAALSAVLYDTGVDVLLTENGRAALMRRSTPAPARRGGAIVGRVADSAGRGIVGAEVFLDRTPWRTMTDTAGRYRLADVDSGSYVLVARRPEYAKWSRRVMVRPEREDTIDMIMAPMPVPLNELVATATGRQRRRDIGNAITTIKADSVLQHAPVRSLTELLQDRVPGLVTQRTSGAPGDPSRLRLRGLNSALRSNDPVVVIDGVRVYAAQSEARSGNLTNALGNMVPAPSPLDQIDPNTIEKVEVFKGSSAATLYGADAANGVIVITTKKGRPGPTRWTANFTQGREIMPGRYPVGYYRWGQDMVTHAPRFCTLIDVKCLPDSLVQFQALNDPALTVFGRGQRTGLSLTASGGSQALVYSVTGSYSDELGLLTLPAYEVERFQDAFQRPAPDWMRRPHHYKTWGVMSNVTARLSATADVTLSASLTRSEQQRTNLEGQLADLSATYIDTINGIYYRTLKGTADRFSNANLVLNQTSAILGDYYMRTTASALTLTTGLSANWQPRSWFTAIGQAGLNVTPRNDHSLVPTYVVPVNTGSDSGLVIRGSGRSIVSTVNVQGVLRKPLGWGFKFETNLGANVNTQSTEDFVSRASGLAAGTPGLANARHITATDAALNQSSYGWYIEPRVSGQRLSLSAGLRLDGGSANGGRLTSTAGRSGSLFSLRNLLALPKLNGSWVISEEPWFPFTSLFSSLRLRGAYGQAQVQPGPVDRLRLYNAKVELTTLGNTQLRPERSTEIEGGFDADMLDGRMSLELTAYRKLQVDALMNVGLPWSVNGGGSVVKNIGNILNRGVELSLALTPVRQQAVTWTAQLHVSHNYNELTKLGRGVDRNPEAGLVAGYPVGSRWAKPILGLADQNGDGVVQLDEIQVGDSLVFVGRLYPAYTTALHTSVVLFGGAVGVTAAFNYEAERSQIDGTASQNWVLARALVDPSAPLSEQAAVVAYAANAFLSSSGTSYGVIQRISTFRFNELSVNYQAPTRIAKLLRAERLGIAVQGSNLALHSTYRGKDPNVNAWSPGEGIVDGGQMPLPRTWQLRVDLTY